MSISSHETPLYTSYKRNASGIFDFFCAKDNVFYFIQFTAPLARRFLPRFPGPLDTPHSACPLFDLDLIPSSGAGFRKFFPCFMTVYSTIPPSFCSNKMPLRNACYERRCGGALPTLLIDQSDLLIHLYCVAAKAMHSSQFSAPAAESRRAKCTPAQRVSPL